MNDTDRFLDTLRQVRENLRQHYTRQTFTHAQRNETVVPPWLYRWMKDNGELTAMEKYFGVTIVPADYGLQGETLDAINDFWRNRG